MVTRWEMIDSVERVDREERDGVTNNEKEIEIGGDLVVRKGWISIQA